MTAFQGFPSSRDTPWPGAWQYGVDFSTDSGSMRVIAVRVGGGDIKYGLHWIGPVALTAESAEALERWAEQALAWDGGYVHLFPADGDASGELADQIESEESEEGAMKDTELYDLAKQFVAERLERQPDQSVAEHVRVNRARGLQAEKRDIKCRRCGTATACVRWTDPAGQIADTWGYMEFNEPDGNVCTNCLGEPYISELLG